MALTRVFKPPWSSSPVADPLGGDVPVPMSQDMIDRGPEFLPEPCLGAPR